MSNDPTYNTNPTLDDIVFENRNKEYGAFDLRQNYSRVLSKSFFIGGSVFLFLVLAPFIYLKVKDLLAPPKVEAKVELINIIQKDKIIEQPKEVKPPPPPPKDPPKQEVIQNVVPEPKVAPKIETPPPPIEKQLTTTTGLQNQEGIKTPAYTPPPPPPSSGKSNTAELKPSNEVYDAVDQTAEFPGGINSFRNKVQSSFDTSVMNGDEGNVKGEITFVVERDGSITDVKATGPNSDFNTEAIRTVKSIRNKWKPAQINGQPVRYKFRLPLTMQFAY